MKLVLPELTFPHNALNEYGMSQETLEFHHDIHHKAYVDNGNKLISGTEWEAKGIEEIIKETYNNSNVSQNGIFNNVAQHWNHCEFWKMLSPEKKEIPDKLVAQLEDNFESVENFKKLFSEAGMAQFGSGWCWLVKEKDGTLKITKTENGVNPLCFDQITLLGCDVWEHSYYIDFRNKRPAYLSNFLDNLVNWDYVATKL